ncbi:putative chitinase Ecym_4512 [Eremothecium cymbalariae DBVPG|uniref:chitinase n=1 Tax=Eremothecium cymbalariae (strain CBS 270.75 / DBVPG 7215 / KCTC 17166 / NRRL Y-17582) TaxID=931890 RepID=G8JU46_ERECY|nr:hypothetical protein Ecym_4512 [Eremothecium cymbalariae DBVPG\
MRRFSITSYSIWILVLLVAIILEMTFIPKLMIEKFKKPRSDIERTALSTITRPVDRNLQHGKYAVGVYYTSWSPYEPRLHFPHDIDFKRVTNVNYAFFVVDPKTGKVQPTDSWSDLEMPSHAPGIPQGVTGMIGELNYLKLQRNTNFRLFMAVGGWSNREAFPKIVRSEEKLKNFVNSTIDAMFEYGFDGIDLDWEFPKDDGYEPGMYLEMCSRLRSKMDKLEDEIWGANNTDYPKFELSVATPAFSQTLKILPIIEMNKFVSIWNMMTYDFHGSWSKRTGYHSNLYDGNKNNDELKKRRFEGMVIDDNEGLNADDAIKIMVENFKVHAKKVRLGMPAYGRGFTNVQTKDDDDLLNKKYSGVGGGSEGEPGIWLYNQLPLANTAEKFDDRWVSAYCFDKNLKTFVGYDNIQSMEVKSDYVKQKHLSGGFFWESCGDTHNDPKRNLVRAFSQELSEMRIPTIFKDPRAIAYYLKHRQKGFLYSLFSQHLQKINETSVDKSAGNYKNETLLPKDASNELDEGEPTPAAT